PAPEPLLGSSMYCETCVPAAIASGIDRDWPPPRSCITCTPDLSVRLSGVTPSVSPSTMTSAPVGFVLMVTMPVPVGPAAGAKNHRDPTSALIAITAVTTAAISAGRGSRRPRPVAAWCCGYVIGGGGGDAFHSDVSASMSGGGSLCSDCGGRAAS